VVLGECGCSAMAAVVAMVMMVRRYHRRSLYSVPVAPIPPVRCAPPVQSGPLGGVPLTTTSAQQPLPDAATPHPLYQVRTVGCGRCTPKLGPPAVPAAASVLSRPGRPHASFTQCWPMCVAKTELLEWMRRPRASPVSGHRAIPLSSRIGGGHRPFRGRWR